MGYSQCSFVLDESAGADEGDQLVEFIQVVLNWRACDEHTAFAWRRLQSRCRFVASALQSVALVAQQQPD
jgi:hypothetical protein